MSKSPKLILLAAGGLIGAIILIAVVVLLILKVNAKRQVQTLVSHALEMEVNVGGRLDIGFFPSFHITMENVQIRNRGSEIASAAQASLGIELFPLLHKEVRLDSIGLKHVKISVERRRDGTFNFETRTGRRFPPTDVARVSLSDATLLYTDQQSGKALEADSCDLDVRHLQLSKEKRAALLKSLSFTAVLACGEIPTKDVVLSELKFSIAGEEGVFDLNPVTMRLFGGQGSGNLRADFSGSVPDYHVRYSLSKFHLAEFFKTLSPRNVGDGPMDFSTNLSLKGKTTDEMVRSAGGEASLHAHDLKLEIGDIDEELSRYESSQSFNLVDVCAFFFAGPLGLAVTKGYHFASLFQSSGGSSQIRTLVSKWKIEHGVAQAKDVAMATKENRIALQGGLDFVNGRFKNVMVAVIDAQGCPRVQQKIHGSFSKPEVERPSILTSLSGPARKLLGQAKSLFGGHCDVFYAGSVAPPH
ncbi:MAG TPA: AsmA family protein [Candidatus Binataceae bacterium]|jgi:AsmA protein|nr:AsmA family protein [Candidatus Binataceae bacterium]